MERVRRHMPQLITEVLIFTKCPSNSPWSVSFAYNAFIDDTPQWILHEWVRCYSEQWRTIV